MKLTHTQTFLAIKIKFLTTECLQKWTEREA